MRGRVAIGEGRATEVLLGMEAISERQLDGAMCARAEELLFEVFGWTSGSFEYFPELRPIRRFLRPVCYQNMPDALLPGDLR